MSDDKRICRRRGFTHVELLMLSLVTALLLAALLPAVQLAREDARVLQCQNNLKQIGIALHNYHDVYALFPPGWVSRRQAGAGHRSSGWLCALLPYVDRAPLYNQIDFHVAENEANSGPFKTPVPAYQCPVDGIVGVNPLRGGWGMSSYSGNYGSIPIPRWSLASGSECFWPGQTPAPARGAVATARLPSPEAMHRPAQHAAPAHNGMFYINSAVGARDVTDGLSNTFLVGERSVLGGGGIWPGPRSNHHESDVLSDGSYASLFNRSDTGFSSRHFGQIMFLLGDGSVRPISIELDSQPEWGVLQKLCAKNDGHPIADRNSRSRSPAERAPDPVAFPVDASGTPPPEIEIPGPSAEPPRPAIERTVE